MSPTAPTGTDPATNDRPSLLWPGVALGVVLVVAKAILLGKPTDLAWVWQLVALTWQDLLCVAAYACLGASLLKVCPGPRRWRWGWTPLILLGAAMIVYTVLHVGFYESFQRAINVQMLRFAGRVNDLRSSVAARLTWPYLLALTALPAAFVVTWRRMPPPSAGRTRLAVLVFVFAWACAGHYSLRGSGRPWMERDWMERMSANPQLVLLSSLITELRGRDAVALPQDFPPGDLEQFRTFAERSTPVAAGAAPARLRNVIFIVLESVSARYLSLYGSPYDTTPRLLAEAGNSLVFDNFYAHVGHTVCSFQSLNFSIYPGLPWCYVPCGERPLPETLPGLLGARGYRTAIMSAADLNYEGMAWAAERHGYARVQSYWDLGCQALSSWGSSDGCLFDGLLRFIDEEPGKPFYVMAWTNQTHDPYTPEPGVEPVVFSGPGHDNPDLARYLNALRRTDEGIGRVLDGLRARGLDRDTLVVITGDHGEAFGEPHDYAGHGGAIYEESVRVPLVLWNPGSFGGRPRDARVGGHVDLNPTIAELLGLPSPGGWQGASLFAAERPNRAFFLNGLGEYQFGVREGRYKYVYSATHGTGRLFDLQSDPDEFADRSAEHPELCRRLRQQLAAWIAYEEQFLAGPAPPASLDAGLGLQ